MVRSKVSLADMALAWGEEERVGTGEGIDGGEGQRTGNGYREGVNTEWCRGL
jgi:hypothetical protein